jgi:hypothetical protein
VSFQSSDDKWNGYLHGLSMVDPIEVVRTHPDWFFRSGRFEPETVTHLLMTEVFHSPYVKRAQFEREGDWIAIASDGDWLEGDLEAFSKPTVFAEAGVNSTRVEVLLTAFCDGVLTSAHGNRRDVRTVGLHDLPERVEQMLSDVNLGRVVAFRAPPSQDEEHAAVQRESSELIGRLLNSLEEREHRFQHAATT